MHARRTRPPRPEAGPIDRRRLFAAGLSAVIPGLGQAFNRRRQLTALFLLPSLLVIAVAAIVWATQTPTRIAAWAVAPAVLGALLTLNAVVLVWRLLAVGQAFLDTRRSGPSGRVGLIGIVVIALLVVVPHLLVYRTGTAFGDAFARIFDDPALVAEGEPPPGPGPNERINVLRARRRCGRRPDGHPDRHDDGDLARPGRDARPRCVSLPRDIVGIPLGNGDTFGPKLNSLMAYADTHQDAFPNGGLRSLQDAIGALLGIPIHYSARMEFTGFIEMVDAVGGVDVDGRQGVRRPRL